MSLDFFASSGSAAIVFEFSGGANESSDSIFQYSRYLRED